MSNAKFAIGCLILLAAAPPVFAQSDFDLFLNPSQYQDVLIEKVLSADTFTLESGEKIKLIGLNAPEPPPRRKTSVDRDPLGFPIPEKADPLKTVEERAFEFARRLLEGKRARLEFDAYRKDEDHRNLAYAFLIEGNVFVNAEILRQGYADLRIQPPNTKYALELREAYAEARREKRGLQSE